MPPTTTRSPLTRAAAPIPNRNFLALAPRPQNPKKSTSNFRIRGTCTAPRGFARRSPLQTLALLFAVLFFAALSLFPIHAHAATTVGISPDYLTRWCREGLVQARRLAGGAWFVSLPSLEKYLAEKQARKDLWRAQLAQRRREELHAVTRTA